MFWGNKFSEEKKTEILEKHEQAKLEIQQKQDDLEKRQLMAFDSEMQEEYQKTMKLKESEIEEESQRNMEKLTTALNNLEKLKQKHQSIIKEWRSTLPEQGQQKKAELQREGDLEIEKRKKYHDELSEKYDKMVVELNNRREALMVKMKENNEIKKQLQNDHDKITKEAIDKHREQINETKNDRLEFQVKSQQEVQKLLQADREDQDKRMDAQEKINAERLIGINQAVRAVKADDHTDSFKYDLDMIRIQHGNVTTQYNNQERSIKRTIDDMEQGEKLKNRPEMTDFNYALDGLLEQVNSVHQRLPQEFKDLNSTFKDVKTVIDKIGDATNNVEKSMRVYRKSLKKAMQEGAMFRNLEHPKIIELFEVLRGFVKDLGELMLKFNIERSNQLMLNLDETLRQSSPSSHQAQLTEESTSGLKHLKL